MSITRTQKNVEPVDVWISPREGAEELLGHAKFPRSRRVIYNLTKKINKACLVHWNKKLDAEYRAYFGLVCPLPLPNGRREIKRSELLRWAERLRIRGIVTEKRVAS